jgi:hypothetical protein
MLIAIAIPKGRILDNFPSSERTWPGCNAKRRARDIFMKLGTLELFLSRN